MPSISHEALVALFRYRPELAPELLRESLQVEVPEYAEIRIEDADLTQLQPAVFKADLVVLLRNGEPVLAIVVEGQLSDDADKRYSWPVYLTTVRSRYRCPACLLVVAPREEIADWASKPIDLGSGWRWAPYGVGPKLVPFVTDAGRAALDPELAVLSALAHGSDPDRGASIALAALSAVAELEVERAALYHDVILATLSDVARTALENLMSSGNYQFQTDFAKKHQAIGRAEGKAEGEAMAVLRVLEARGLAVSKEQRARVLAATDLALFDRWLVRSLTATSTDEVFAD